MASTKHSFSASSQPVSTIASKNLCQLVRLAVLRAAAEVGRLVLGRSINGLPKVAIASDVISRRLLGIPLQECDPHNDDRDKDHDRINLAEAVCVLVSCQCWSSRQRGKHCTCDSSLLTAQSWLIWACDKGLVQGQQSKGQDGHRQQHWRPSCHGGRGPHEARGPLNLEPKSGHE
eukprot:s6216_g3.t1